MARPWCSASTRSRTCSNFDDPEERFTKAVGNLMQIANRVPSSIVVISVLEEFYGQARAKSLHQSYIDRIEKSGPVALYESRSADEARRIIAKRLEHPSHTQQSEGPSFPDASSSFFGPEFFEEFAGLSTTAPARAGAEADCAKITYR